MSDIEVTEGPGLFGAKGVVSRISLCHFSVFSPISISRIQWIAGLNIPVVFSEVAHNVDVFCMF